MQLTGVGSAMNAHFARGPLEWSEDLAAIDPKLRQIFFFHLLACGIYISPRGFIVLSLPVTDEALERMVAAVAAFV